MSAPDRSIPQILESIVGNVQEIVRSEIRLAKIELQRDGDRLLRSTLWMGGGVLCGVLGAATLIGAVVAALASIIPLWESALFTGIGLGIASAVLMWMGSRRFSMLQAPLAQTMDALNGGKGTWISSSD